MLRLLFVVAALILAASVVQAGPEGAKGQNQADRQQAIDHSREVHRLKEHTREHDQERRRQTEEDLEKVKEQAEQEEGFGNDLEDENDQ